MTARWFTFFVWAAAAASAMFWGLKVLVKPPPGPPLVQVATGQGAPRGDLTRLLGVDAAPAGPGGSQEPPPDGRFSLIGVVSPRATQAAVEGVALISVDGKPAKAFRIGAVVDGEPLVALVAREQEAVGGLGGRGRDQLRDRVRELLQAVFAHDVQAAVARVRQEVGAEQLRCQN